MKKQYFFVKNSFEYSKGHRPFKQRKKQVIIDDVIES